MKRSVLIGVTLLASTLALTGCAEQLRTDTSATTQEKSSVNMNTTDGREPVIGTPEPGISYDEYRKHNPDAPVSIDVMPPHGSWSLSHAQAQHHCNNGMPSYSPMLREGEDPFWQGAGNSTDTPESVEPAQPSIGSGSSGSEPSVGQDKAMIAPAPDVWMDNDWDYDVHVSTDGSGRITSATLTCHKTHTSHGPVIQLF
jgi:hypothetical protein